MWHNCILLRLLCPPLTLHIHASPLPPCPQTRHQFEIHLENQSQVEECVDEEDIPQIFFNVRRGCCPLELGFLGLARSQGSTTAG